MGKKRRQDATAIPASKRKRGQQREHSPSLLDPHSVSEPNPSSVPVIPLVGEFAALRLKEYDDEIPQIAKVLSVSDLEVSIEWWIGGWNQTWNQWKTKGQPNTATVHKNAVIMAPFLLTKSNRLPKDLLAKLRNLYADTEFI